MQSQNHGFWGVTSEEILRNKFPLHCACRDGDVEALSLLLVDAHHGIFSEDSFYGWTPAHWAAYFGKLACLRKLMSSTRVGLECNVLSSRFKQTPTHLAAFGDQPHCLNWLLQSGGNAEAEDYLGETPAHKAARTGSIECLSLLASHNARLDLNNKSGQSPGQLAAACRHMDCANYLEAVANRQEESLPMGVYKNQRVEASITPATHDITANNANTIPPCVINYGINVGRLPPQPPTLSISPFSGGGESQSPSPFNPVATHHPGCESDHNSEVAAIVAMEQEADMEEDEVGAGMNGTGFDDLLQAPMNVVARQRRALTHRGDVTLSNGVSANVIPIAGKKRCREESDEVQVKRSRKLGECVSICSKLGCDNFVRNPCAVLCEVHTFKPDQHECLMSDTSPRDVSHDPYCEEELTSDTAVEHRSSVLLELGYGEIVSEALYNSLQDYHES